MTSTIPNITMSNSQLFSPYTIGHIPLNNRIVIPPMCQYSASHGQATEWHLMHYGNLALSGAGLLIFEATAVCPEGRISYADLGLWDQQTAHALQKVVSFIRLHSEIPLAIQLAHAGRKASTDVPWENGGYIAPDRPNGWQTVAPSAIPLSTGGTIPQELSKDDIQSIIVQFAKSAERAVSIGFDAIELHAAHGYLIHQFLSPITNKRMDEYGGSLVNRLRFVLEVFAAVRSAVPEHIAIGVRISATDWIENGWDLVQSIALAKALEERGCNFIHVSGGGVDGGLQQLPSIGTGYQLPYAAAIKEQVEIPVIGVGLIRDAHEAEQALVSGKSDLIAVGREMLYNPRWGWHAAAALGEHISVPPQYVRSEPRVYKGLFKEH